MGILIRAVTILLIITVVQIAVSKIRQEKSTSSKNTSTVYFSNIYAIVGIVGALISTFAIIYMALYPNSTGSIWIGLWFIFMVLCGIYLILLSLVWRIYLFPGHDYFVYVSIFGIRHIISYNDILYYKYAKQFTHIKTRSRVFLVDNDANNVDQLLHMLEIRKVCNIK